MLFPESAKFNKRIPKQKFYQNLDISPTLKKTFVEQIQSVYWSYKLSPETVRIASGATVSEIEVFEVKLTGQKVDEAVLKQIDKQIPYHILYILSYEDKIQLAIAHKDALDSGNNAFKVNHYFYTQWQNRADTTIAINGHNLDLVWDNFIIQIGGVHVSDGNTLAEQIAVDDKRAKLEKEIARLEKQARAEKQPKKKFELVQKLNKLRKNMENSNGS